MSKIVYSTRWMDEDADRTDLPVKGTPYTTGQDHNDSKNDYYQALAERKSAYTFTRDNARTRTYK